MQTEHNTLEKQVLMVPNIEENIPLPKSAADAMPILTPTQELEMRAATIKLISDLTGSEIVPSEENIKEAEGLAKQMMNNPSFKPDYSQYPNETMAFLAGMVAQTKCMLVEDLADLKLYVINNLIKEVETSKDSKSRITALSKLGEIDGVDAFKRRSELVVKQQSLEEVENELLETLKSLKGRVIEGEVIESRVNK
jgi:hypothetical protein